MAIRTIREQARQNMAALKGSKTGPFAPPSAGQAPPLTQSAKNLADRKSQINQLKKQGDL